MDSMDSGNSRHRLSPPAILIVLCSAVLLLLALHARTGQKGEDASPDAESVKIPLAVEEPYCETMVYSTDTARLSFALNEDGAWIWTDEPDFPLDDANIIEILSIISDISTRSSASETDVFFYGGFDAPAAVLSVGFSNGSSIKVTLGNATADGTMRFAYLNQDENIVYLVDSTLHALLTRPIYDLCILPELPFLPEDILETVSIQGPVGEDGERSLTLLSVLHADRNNWYTADDTDVTELPTIRALAESLNAPYFSRCVDYSPSSMALSLCGFDTPEGEMEILYQDESGQPRSLRLTIGTVLADGSSHYIRLGEEETVYAMSGRFLNPWLSIALSGLGQEQP